MNIGSSNRQKYDNCAYQKRLYESTSPLKYQLYEGKFENCGKCLYDKFWRPFDLVDVESELRNQNRPLSQCDQFKYNPNCPRSKMCLSTFDPSVPVVYVPEICPIVFNNIPKRISPGYVLPEIDFCGADVGPFVVADVGPNVLAR
ncbi:MAG: hypothetical protein Edafosvirus25_10 [Edafosvirus sp.]|uniref:Uncharacterized protein n=1 Tax=Edafosvirus sp. TaxID=2487765 RepID=A0A3G4ZUW8_9VIRU|nr:MAG: hypothetical protein Edafosvirus25_10 [Edafosvirus sp.]